MPEVSTCLWCSQPLQLTTAGWAAGFSVRCGALRRHHPNLDVPVAGVLLQPTLVERWLAA